LCGGSRRAGHETGCPAVTEPARARGLHAADMATPEIAHHYCLFYNFWSSPPLHYTVHCSSKRKTSRRTLPTSCAIPYNIGAARKILRVKQKRSGIGTCELLHGNEQIFPNTMTFKAHIAIPGF
jgi:hypothetical protein